MFAVVTLAYLADIAERVYANGALCAEALALRQQIDDGTHSPLNTSIPPTYLAYHSFLSNVAVEPV